MAKKSNFQQVFEEVKSEVSTTPKGKPMRSFSRSAFDRLAKAMVNDINYKIEQAGVKKGELVKKDLYPVQEYRKSLHRILVDFGVDKQEADRILTEEYEIRHVDGFYELVSELPYQYMNAGKKFDFIQREDFSGSLTIKEVDETTTEHQNIRTKEKFKVKKQKHKVLEKQSKAPSWLKSKA